MDEYISKTTEQEKSINGKTNIVETMKERESPFSLASLELLTKYEHRMERLKRKQLNNTVYCAPCNSATVHKLSTVEIMKIARARYNIRNSDDLSAIINPLCGGDRYVLSSESADDVELAMFLFASVEKISNLEFDRARKFLSMCFHMASPMGNSVQRLVHCYAVALQERVARRKGIMLSESLESNQKWKFSMDKVITSSCPSVLAHRQELPFILAMESVGVQAILESVTSAKRIHLIDLGIRSGVQWSSLMQALAVREECPLEILKITAVSTKSKEMIKETGRRLISFAESLSLPFSFNLIMLSEMKDLTAELIDLDVNEGLVVHSEFLFVNMIRQLSHLETLIKVIKSLNPVLMVVYEIETTTTSPGLMDRFFDSLLFHSAQFDSLEDCMDRSDPHRLRLESYLRGGIRDIMAFENDERTIWHMKIDEWRSFFRNFGVVETELSVSSLYQANLVVKNYTCGSSCTLDIDGKSLLIGWKGTPVLSVSAWNFHLE